jgi:predicted metal-binding membrane protein
LAPRRSRHILDRGSSWAFLPRLLLDADGASVRGGMMSIAWTGAIALFVLLEKTVPWGDRMSRLGGVLLFVWGVIGLVQMI